MQLLNMMQLSVESPRNEEDKGVANFAPSLSSRQNHDDGSSDAGDYEEDGEGGKD